MRHLIIFILILTISISNSVSCVFYPFGEDVRFSIFNPDYFAYKDFLPFYYSAHSFSPNEYESIPPYDKDKIETSQKLNIELWRKRCNNIPSEKDVYDVVYIDQIIHTSSPNHFIQYLYKNKDFEAISYLEFIKECAPLNTYIADPWERNVIITLPQRSKLIKRALEKTKVLTDKDIKLRYAFIAIRLAYYNRDFEIITRIYNDNFSNRKHKNIIDYWSMYFKALVEPKGALRNYYASQVFANAPDKRFVIHDSYNKRIDIHKTLTLARTNKEKASIWLLAGIRNPARALESIKRIYNLDPHSKGMGFLLLREINKLEDWIYTPYYTHFEPSIFEQEAIPSVQNLNRIIKDKAYAQEVLNFINSIRMNKVENPLTWKIAKAYLLYMLEDYSAALVEINSIQNWAKKDSKELGQLEIVKALCLTSRQSKGNAIIIEEVKPILMRHSTISDRKFIFAIARELEYKGNTTDAAILLSKLNSNEDWKDYIYWKVRQNNQTLYNGFYFSYFSYLDEQYTSGQISKLIADIEHNQNNNNFDSWKYEIIKNNINRLYDLLGTKYLRENELNKALSSFEKVDDILWNSNQYRYKENIDANPFYTNLYNEHVKTKADTIKYNKESITRTLINYLLKAEDVKKKDRDYYYFLVANCYLNMTQYGNSWMMKRYYWSSHVRESHLQDNSDYLNCDYAKKYYLKAKTISKNKRFSALCLRMAGRCEKYRLTNKYKEEGTNLSWDQFSDIVFNENKYFKQIKNQYPDYYNDLISNCESFDTYLRARK